MSNIIFEVFDLTLNSRLMTIKERIYLMPSWMEVLSARGEGDKFYIIDQILIFWHCHSQGQAKVTQLYVSDDSIQGRYICKWNGTPHAATVIAASEVKLCNLRYIYIYLFIFINSCLDMFCSLTALTTGKE